MLQCHTAKSCYTIRENKLTHSGEATGMHLRTDRSFNSDIFTCNRKYKPINLFSIKRLHQARQLIPALH